MSRGRMTSLALVAFVTLGLFGCGKEAPRGGGGQGGGKRKLEFPVETAPVVSRRVEYTLSAVGSVDAFERVQITARVSGVVERVGFREGSRAQKAQILVEIEPARYRLQASSARAALERAQATEADAKAGLARRESVVVARPGLIPGEELEEWRTKARTATAEVAQARVALQRAELDLRDSQVRAPIAGVIETRTVQTGQYAQPGTVLGTLVRRDPLLLRFDVPEADAARLRTGMMARFTLKNAEGEHAARISHVAQAADPRSRMVAVTADVDPAAREALRPGAFAEVSVPIGEARDAPVIPQTAIRASERGFLAFVVEAGTAHERVLTLGMHTADAWVEVRSGLKAGELLVVRGNEALREGAKVTEEREDAAPAPTRESARP